MDWTFAPPAKASLEDRVIAGAEANLQHDHEVTPINVFCRLQLLHENDIQAWRNGSIRTLDEMMQGGPEKVAKVFRILRDWAAARDLKPFTGKYSRATRAGEQELRFTGAKFAGLEEAFRTHYIPAGLTERQRKSVEARATKVPERVVFRNLRESACTECGCALPVQDFVFIEDREPLCLLCANLGDLEYLERGDAAMTRRATKYSERHAVVVQFSRARKRYERQGILVTERALRQAEEECAADAPERARLRGRAAAKRENDDAAFIQSFTATILDLLPGCPPDEANQIARHAGSRGSGRVGRTEQGRQLDRKAVALAVVAALRHNHTNYDELLANGIDRAEARERVRGEIQAVFEKWGGTSLS